MDMNGVFRHFDDSGARVGEKLGGLPPGTIKRYAYDHFSYELAKVGVLTNEEWIQGVERRLVADFGTSARRAVGPWQCDRGRVDVTMRELIERVRKTVPVALLSNFTDALHTDVIHHGLSNSFDFVFPSHDLLVQKPSPLAFMRAASKMGIPTSRLLFFDDQDAFVAGGLKAGMIAHVFTGATSFVEILSSYGIRG